MSRPKKLYYYCKTCGSYTERRARIDSHMYSNEKHKMGIVSENTKLKTYFVDMKSHTDAPDYEDECEAPTFEVAVKMLTDNISHAIAGHPEGIKYGAFWDEKEVRKYVNEIKD